MTIFPHGAVPDVAVVPVGDPPAEALRVVSRTIEDTIDTPAPVRDPVAVPEGADLGEARDAADYQRATAEAHDGDLVVGVTADELAWERYDADSGEYYVEDELFGLVQVGGSVTVLSLARLAADAPPSDRFTERLRKVTRRHVGMLFGYEDCDGCVVAATPDLQALDAKPDEFCDDCARRLRDPETAPEPDDWHVTTAEIERIQRYAAGDLRLTDYPVLALGWLVVSLQRVAAALPSLSRVSLPRPVRAFVHEVYRIGRFWWKVATFLLAYVVVAGGLATVVGMENLSDALAWLLLVVSLPLAWLLGELANAILGGLVLGVVEGVRLGFEDDLGPEE